MIDRTQERDAALTQLSEARARQTHNRRVASAREHVGAAGWAQSAALEKIIHAGREQFAVTDALRQVVNLTLTQLRQVSLEDIGQFGPGQASALKTIIESGGEQVDAALALQALIEDALAAVVDTPLGDLSVTKLEHIRAAVERQTRALHDMIAAAKSQAHTLEQLRALDAVSAEQQARVASSAHTEAELKVLALEQVAGQAAHEIGQLSKAGEGAQLAALEQVAARAVDEIRQLADTPEQEEALRHVAERAQGGELADKALQP